MPKPKFSELIKFQIGLIITIIALFATIPEIAFGFSVFIIYALYWTTKNLGGDPVIISDRANAILLLSPIIGIYWFFHEPKWYQEAKICYFNFRKILLFCFLSNKIDTRDLPGPTRIKELIKELEECGEEKGIIIGMLKQIHSVFLAEYIEYFSQDNRSKMSISSQKIEKIRQLLIEYQEKFGLSQEPSLP